MNRGVAPHATTAGRVPALRWMPMLLAALVMLLLAVGGLELALAQNGFRPNLSDSFPLWERQRERADRLGPRALVLAGNSRVLIDLDLDELRADSGLEPVQLGVGGASFLPVLEDLAKDPAVKGTVVVNFEPDELIVKPRDLAASYVAQRGPAQGTQAWDFANLEATVTDELHSRLRSYADGARPLTALLLRAAGPRAPVQYVKMLPDREELADFTLVRLPNLYLLRAVHDFPAPPNVPKGSTLDDERQIVIRAIAALAAEDPQPYLGRYAALAGLVAEISQRGGRVIFLRLPRCGYLRDIDDKRFPRKLFWDPLAAMPGVQTLDFEDVPSLKGFSCPDGSHLDMRDKARFTRALDDALHLDSAHP